MRTLSGLFVCCFVLGNANAADISAGRKVLTETIAQTYIGGQSHKTGTVTRQLLTPGELAANQPVHFVLKMRNFDELQARIQRGEVISIDEMGSRYFPTYETWARIAVWARAQGLTVKDDDRSHMTVFASSTVTQVQSALQMTFARVIGTDGREYTSAITPPSLPTELGDSVVGIRKLQPHLRPFHAQTITPTTIGGYISPTTIAQLYNASGLGWDGTGQTIVIVGLDTVTPSDLTAFWQACGLPTTLAQFTEIDPDGPPTSSDLEETMDIEWASAMAPGARIVYFSSPDPDKLQSWLVSQTTFNSVNQVSSSYLFVPGQTEPDSQYYAAMVALGVTNFNASGDYGSTGAVSSRSGGSVLYASTGITAPSYPSSDPYVTGVGGTYVSFTSTFSGPQTPVTEGGWCLPSNQPLSADTGDAASTGGISTFARPSWQSGAGVPAGTMRCVPDVAAMAMGNYSAAVIYHGKTFGEGGTSQSSPVWSGLCALINQARAGGGLPPVGLLGPKIYPLNGTTAFNQLTTGGTNGAYTVGPNYNMVTGLGSPNVGNLIAALTVPTTGTAPVITTQPTPQTVLQGGTVTFTVAASGTPAPSYQWTMNGIAVSDGLQPDDSIASGSTSNTLTIANAQTTGPIKALATNAIGVAASDAVTLTVNLPNPPIVTVTTLAGSGVAGSIDGAGSHASFNAPGDVAVDSAGNIYVADSNNNTIRKMTSAGVVTTLAGNGSAGSTDGTGTAASFNNPTGLALDGLDNVYITDTNNNTIRKVTPAGVVTTMAGNGSAGSVDGTGTGASFNWPTGPAVDALGNVYVANQGNNTIRKVTPAGVVTTLAGSGYVGWSDGTGTAASFDVPAGVAVDGSGTVYEADAGNGEIRKISPAGVVTTLAGSVFNSSGSTNGSGANASFWGPAGVAVDGFGNVYVADAANNEIRKVSPGGAVITLAGSTSAGTTDGTGTIATFNNPQGVASDASGNVYVADFGNNKIRMITQVPQAVPVITWAAPAEIISGTPLSATQLDATANVTGIFVYSPAAGTVLSEGVQTLSVTFTPTDTTEYIAATAAQTLSVVSANTAFLQGLFPLVLGRPVDSGALAAYAAAMSAGYTHSQVYGDLISSSEYSAWQIEPVIRLYYAALARMPDYAGLRNWSVALHGGVLTLTGAADQFAASAEFVLKYSSLDNTQFVQQLYLNVLGRQADPAGLADWIGLLNSGASRGTVLVGFSESPEFQADIANQVEIVRLYYLLEQRMPTAAEMQSWIAFLNGDDQTDTLFAHAYPFGLSDSAYVQAVFQGFLCRDADAGALNSFTAGLAAGTVTHGSLVDTVLSSAEFNTYVGPVSRLYLAAFHRVPDQPGLINWVNYMRAGNTLESVADAFVASQEFQLTYGTLDDTQYVTLLYENVLGRQPDPTGLADWTGQLAGVTTRGQVLIGFSQSPEAISLFVPTLRTTLSYFAFLNAPPTQQDLDYWTNYLTTLTDQFRETFLKNVGAAN